MLALVTSKNDDTTQKEFCTVVIAGIDAQTPKVHSSPVPCGLDFGTALSSKIHQCEGGPFGTGHAVDHDFWTRPDHASCRLWGDDGRISRPRSMTRIRGPLVRCRVVRVPRADNEVAGG